MRTFPNLCIARISAFSLLQLLVVMGVLGVLVAILIPVAGDLRQQAYQIGCISNMRQMGVALNAYANEHSNRYPATFGPLRNPPDNATWMTKVAPYAGMGVDAMGATPLPRSVGVFICPAFSKEAVARREVSYRYNNNIWNIWQCERFAMPVGKIILVVEAEGENNDVFHPVAGRDVARRHPGNAANFLFTDGRVETYRELIPDTDTRWGRSRNLNHYY